MNHIKSSLLVFFLTVCCGIYPVLSADVLSFTVTRTGLPKLTYYDLTLRVDACGASKAIVSADGQAIESRIEQNRVIFTTHGTNISVALTGVTDKKRLGSFSKAVLKDDKHWAWSNGFDDNKMFKNTAIPLLEKHGYRSTVFLIGSILSDTREENWIIDRPDIMRLVQKGWGIGNHTWSHSTVPCYRENGCKWGTPEWNPNAAEMDKAKAEFRQLHKYLREACDKAGRTDYRLIAFAAPMFDSRWQPVIADLRKNGDAEVQFNESGNRSLLVVDPDWVAKNEWSSPSKFNPAGSLGRDWAIEAFGTGGKNDPKATLLAEIAKCGEKYHIWYNSLCHGVGDNHGIMKFIPWVYDNYGKGGNNTVWVAPSDEIYSYLLVRDNTTVTFNSSSTAPNSSKDRKTSD